MKLTQNHILASAMRRRWVTPRDAYLLCGTLRFSGRVLELKRAGYRLIERWVETQDYKRVKAFRIGIIRK